MGRMSREKGKRGEREVAEILRNHGYAARRGQQFHGGADSPDVVGLPGFHIEVKYTQRFDLYGALKQAETDSSGMDDVPLVVHRKAAENGQKKPDWVAVLKLEDFLKILEDAR